MRILAADDEEDVRLLLEFALGMQDDIELTLASSGDEAIAMATEHGPFALIVLDGLMPGRDGASTCRALKAEPRTAGVPVVFLSALSGDGADALRAAGADGIVRKPFDPMTLADELRGFAAG